MIKIHSTRITRPASGSSRASNQAPSAQGQGLLKASLPASRGHQGLQGKKRNIYYRKQQIVIRLGHVASSDEQRK